MNYKQILVGMACFAGMTTSSVMAATFTHTPLPRPTHTSHRALPRFVNVAVDGHLHVVIRPAKHHKVFFSIRNRDPVNNWVYTRVSGQTLYLKQGGTDHHKLADVTVYMNRLDNLSVYGHSSIRANKINSKHLTVTADTTGSVTLNGVIGLSHLYANGHSTVSMKWLNSRNLTVFTNGKSRVNLAGTADAFHAKVSNHSFLNTKYLRSRNAWIITRNRAQATVLAIDGLQAYPKDDSNIYYYKSADVTNRINKQSGNTLQLGWNT